MNGHVTGSNPVASTNSACRIIFRFSNVHLGESAGEPDAIGFLALPEWRFHKPIGELTSSGLLTPSAARDRRLGDLELLVAEVGDEFEGTAEGGDVAVQDVLGGDVAAFDLGYPGN